MDRPAHVRLETDEIGAARPGMAFTLNGIAQGYIADRIAQLLTEAGLMDHRVDMGEIVATGRRPEGRAWQAGVGGMSGQVMRRVALSGRALATSAPQGTLIDPVGGLGHIIDPSVGRPGGGRWSTVSVSAPIAAFADGLSTAFCLMPPDAISRALAAYLQARLELLVGNDRNRRGGRTS
ncbi:MAG: FAD:protein FMN transferase [Pseudomonadota bacterium]